MRRCFLFLLFATIAITAYGQRRNRRLDISEDRIEQICDSIVRESYRIYRYEKAAWLGSDLAYENNKVKREGVNYLVYETAADVYRFCMLDKDLNCIAEMDFISDDDSGLPKPSFRTRELSSEERMLFDLRNTILDHIVDGDYEVGYPEGYSLNFVLLPYENSYIFYILTGTSMPDVMPFGNDYVFFTDTTGKIRNWRKMHSVLIPMDMTEPVRQTVHSHLEHEPYITATDIATFRLYGPLYEQETFTVLSSALNRYMEYDRKTNKITVFRPGMRE